MVKKSFNWRTKRYFSGNKLEFQNLPKKSTITRNNRKLPAIVPHHTYFTYCKIITSIVLQCITLQSKKYCKYSSKQLPLLKFSRIFLTWFGGTTPLGTLLHKRLSYETFISRRFNQQIFYHGF